MTSLVDLVPARRRSDGVAAAAAALPPAELASAVLALGESEARSAADVLHDGVLQSLVVARYAADAAVRGGDPVAARDAVQEALVALRRAVWMLRPRGEQGLLAALEQLALHLDEAGSAPLSVDVDADSALALETRLAPAPASAAYRLVQHATGPRPLTVEVRCTDTAVRLALDVAVPDPATEALRARAAGGTLLATRDGTCLHLPLAPPPALPFVPAPRDGRSQLSTLRTPSHRTDEEAS